MNEKYDINYRSIIMRLLRQIFVYTLIIHIVVAVFCFFIGWRTDFYGFCLIVGGGIVFLLGLISSLEIRPSTRLGVPNPFGLKSSYRETGENQKVPDKISSYNILFIVVGVLTIISGYYIKTL